MSNDLVQLSSSARVIEGIHAMMREVLGDNEYVQMFVELSVACLIVTVAKFVEDRPEWFPRGKWATIQAIESQIQDALERARHERHKKSHPKTN